MLTDSWERLRHSMIWLQSSPEVSGDQQNSSQWIPSPNSFQLTALQAC